MTKSMQLLVWLTPLALIGCGVQTSPKQAVRPSKPADAAMLSQLLLKEKPQPARTVDDARAHAQSGEEIVLEGTIPPGQIKGFLADRAAFYLMTKADIEKNKEEFECADPG
jgi:hypothetical protein